MFKIKQHIELDKNYNIIHYTETQNDIITFWERFYYTDNKIEYSEDSNNYQYFWKNNKKVNKKPIDFIDPYDDEYLLDAFINDNIIEF